jgi:hypothetical protein
MIRCRGTKRNGERCTQSVKPPNVHCWAHDPENADERRRIASRAGSSKGSREVLALKDEIKSLIADVRNGELDRNNAAVMIQGYRVLKDLVELERRTYETEELARQVEELKREYSNAS